MSCYETHRGILRKVDNEGKSIREFLHDIALGENEEIQFDEDYDINDNLGQMILKTFDDGSTVLEISSIPFDKKISPTGKIYEIISTDFKEYQKKKSI